MMLQTADVPKPVVPIFHGSTPLAATDSML